MILNLKLRLKHKRQSALNALCFLVLSGSAFTSFINNHHQLPLTASSQQVKKKPGVFEINPIPDSDLQFTDLTKNFAAPGPAANIRMGDGGSYILVNFMNLLYSEFLTPLSKANPDLNIPSEPTDAEAFFIANGIEAYSGGLENHDGDSISSTWDVTAPSYPTTLAVVQLLNIFLLPLDKSNEFEQLSAKNSSGTFNPNNGFFAQFINYILTQQLNVMLGWNYYQRNNNGTSINTGMFDFDEGFNYYLDANWPGAYYTIDSGHDSSNTAFAGLSSQINNFMFLLDSYVNFAAGLLNNLTSITNDPTGQWLLLNNLTTLGAFHTPNLADTAAGADGRRVTYDDQNAGAATIFTALPRFLINASYGDGPFNGITRYWGVTDNHYMLLLHYNGLISGYLWGHVEHHDFVHSSPQNTGHYYAYTDTTALSNLKAEQQIIGQMLYLRAWNSEVNYLWAQNKDVFNAICLTNWPDSISGQNNFAAIDNNALLIQPADKINGLFTIQSLIKQLQKTFNSLMTLKIVPFQNHFESLTYLYDQYHYGFQENQNGQPIVNPYVDLTALFELTPQTLAPYGPKAQAFRTEQTTILMARISEINTLYKTVDLGFIKHVNGDPLQYPLPDLLNDDPQNHGCETRADLYSFYADHRPNPTSDQYFNDFKLEQLAIQKEHQNTPTPKTQSHFPLWAIILIISGAVISIGLMIIYFFQRTRRKTSPTSQQTLTKTLD